MWTRALAAAALLLAAGLGGAAELTLRKAGDNAEIKLRADAPAYRASPGSYLHGGAYPPPHPYYYPYPYPPPATPAPTEQAGHDAGHVILLIDPVGAEVFLDGVRLRQRDDLSYAVAVLEGRHVLRIAAPGYEPYEKPIEVLGGRGAFLTVRLHPQAAHEAPEARQRNRRQR